jgi:hypothetical protein
MVCVRCLGWSIVIGLALLAWGGVARAAEPAAEAPRLRLALAADAAAMPEPSETPPPSVAAGGAPAAAEPVGSLEEEGSMKPGDLHYGGGARLRWVTVPSWLLNIFTARNVPLSSWATAVELFRRKGGFDFALAFGYQNMSPPDGNWLGKGNVAATDTDLVQFRSLAIWTIDASFVWRNWFSRSFGIHYGAGLGLGIVTGELLRTSSTGACATTGDPSQCHPLNVSCPNGVCNEQQLVSTQVGNNCKAGSDVDGPQSPHRFCDSNVPGAVPIVNVVVGVDFRLPQVPGFEVKVEGGFYDAFFLGGGAVYMY